MHRRYRELKLIIIIKKKGNKYRTTLNRKYCEEETVYLMPPFWVSSVCHNLGCNAILEHVKEHMLRASKKKDGLATINLSKEEVIIIDNVNSERDASSSWFMFLINFLFSS